MYGSLFKSYFQDDTDFFRKQDAMDPLPTETRLVSMIPLFKQFKYIRWFPSILITILTLILKCTSFSPLKGTIYNSRDGHGNKNGSIICQHCHRSAGTIPATVDAVNAVYIHQ